MDSIDSILATEGEDIPAVSKVLADIGTSDKVENVLASSFNDMQKSHTANIFEEKKHEHWKENTDLARCDFKHIWKITPRGGVVFISIWKKSIMGKLLTEIKEDESMVNVFAEGMVDAIVKVLGSNLHSGDWALITAPKRRHMTRNFATLVCIQIAERLHIPFYEDILHCSSKHRVGAIFTISEIPKQHNIIVFDDIVTTGSTLGSINKAFEGLGKNLIFFAGINNKL